MKRKKFEWTGRLILIIFSLILVLSLIFFITKQTHKNTTDDATPFPANTFPFRSKICPRSASTVSIRTLSVDSNCGKIILSFQTSLYSNFRSEWKSVSWKRGCIISWASAG